MIFAASPYEARKNSRSTRTRCTAPVIRPTVEDCASVEVRELHAAMEGRHDPRVHLRLEPRLVTFGGRFPAREVALGKLRIRYVPIAIKQPDVELEQVNGSGHKGRPRTTIWADKIAPAFGM